MRILALETSGRHGSIAALEGFESGPNLLHEIALQGNQRTAQSLIPALRELLAQVHWPAKSVELLAVTVGPGSFTGLRIGVTTAKTFAYAVGAQVIGVNTLAVLAGQVQHFAPEPTGLLWAILDAQRQELFVSRFKLDSDSRYTIDTETSILSQEGWLEKLQPGDAVIGPPLKTLASQLPADVVKLPEAIWQPMASAVGRVAWRAFQTGHRDDVWKLSPHYFRASAAEEKLAT